MIIVSLHDKLLVMLAFTILYYSRKSCMYSELQLFQCLHNSANSKPAARYIDNYCVMFNAHFFTAA